MTLSQSAPLQLDGGPALTTGTCRRLLWLGARRAGCAAAALSLPAADRRMRALHAGVRQCPSPLPLPPPPLLLD
jgi:hypothetical protein